LRDPFGFLIRVAQRGAVVRARLGSHTMHIVSEAEAARRVLVDHAANYRKSSQLRTLRIVTGDGLILLEGQRWRQHRTALQPAFNQEHMSGFAARVITATSRLMERWNGLPGETPVCVVSEMMRLSMNAMLRCLFSVDLEIEDDSVSNAVKAVMREVVLRISLPISFPLSLPTPRNRRFKRNMLLLDRLIEHIRTERPAGRDSLAGSCDVIGLWLERAESLSGPLTAQEFRDELMTLFISGHETTASLLSWAWYLLWRNPEVRRKMREEVDRVLGRRSMTPDDVSQLSFTKMVVQEVARLYPQPPVLNRQSVDEDVLAGCRIPANAEIMISTYAIHRSPLYWAFPEVFDPTRFSEARKQERVPAAYFPFGVGPRACLGARLATLEATIVLAMIAQRFDLDCAPGHQPQAELLGAVQPRGGLPMTIRKRTAE
jgi:cytochrome P450